MGGCRVCMHLCVPADSILYTHLSSIENTEVLHSLCCSELYSRGVLDSFLSRALNIELENKRLALIDESNYVLTLDYTIKMLNIHER